ncbi:MAG: DNA polymerase III subunit gamma/tau [Nitrospirota bacterium]
MNNYVVLARKWRPQIFDDVVGQGHVARTLCNAMAAGRIAHAYLFCGPRGVGKTTMARLLAKALNCQSSAGPTPTPCQSAAVDQQCEPCREITQGASVDVMEIDGASNRGIDEIRNLRENIKYAPLKGRRRVYIIDEVHMLTDQAFNALLKTLEEPPPHVVFIFATTEIHKVPMTIQSRCQQFVFRRLTRREIVDRLAAISKPEGFALAPSGLALIAQAADGSLRDALSLLDQAIAYGGPSIGDEELRQLLGVIDRHQMAALFTAIAGRDAASALAAYQRMAEQGQDPRQCCGLILEWLRHLTVAKLCPPSPERERASLLDLPPEEQQAVEQLAARFTAEELQRLFLLWGRVAEELKGSLDPAFSMEMGIVRSTQLPALESFSALLQKVAELEQRLGGAMEEKPLPAAAPPQAANAVAARPAPAPAPPNNESAEAAAAPIPDAPAAWAALMGHVRQQKPYLATYLSDVRLLAVTDRELALGYPPSASVMIERLRTAANREFLDGLIGRQFCRPLRMKLVELPPEAVPPPARVSDGPAPSAGETLPPLEPLLETVLDLFGGRVTSPPQPGPPGTGSARTSPSSDV